MTFNNKLYELRKQKGLSQDELGSKLNVSRQTISKWELGETTPELEKLIKISRFFNISIDELVMETDESTTNKLENNIETGNVFKKHLRNIDEKNLKSKAQKGLKILFIIFAIDIISMVIYFLYKLMHNNIY
ncbi:MAG: helix-turn-helix transcriptional regulator [Clostridiaceae bacterium]|nr:helix-turn-helix transcriptional regulator [Clostridiaceae bacterium]MBW4860555.1 helix-turn-helix transcriptional regulator [Clostridiaceae bacterium]MBW4868471.1 helix-turn-helix transcriptional regulator [Clostridiaceae bacterium]